MRLGTASSAAIAEIFTELEARARVDIPRLGGGVEPVWARYAQMRYAGQGFEVHVDLPPGPIGQGYAEAAMAAFREAYEGKNKFLDPAAAIEAVDWTLVASLPTDRRGGIGRPTDPAVSALRPPSRMAYFPEAGGYVETRILTRHDLADGRITGPAIIEDPDSTTVVLPGDTASISSAGHLIVEIGGGGE
jgi:N-methylhydantoinase A